MKDIYGEEYRLISERDYNKMWERIDELERDNKEMREWISNLAATSHKASEQMLKDCVTFFTTHDIEVREKKTAEN